MKRSPRIPTLSFISVISIATIAALSLLHQAAGHHDDASAQTSSGIHKIKHVVIIMQENRSFDHYFGTFPGADGIPMRNGVPTVCVPDPSGACQRPFHDSADLNGGGPHFAVAAT